MRYSLSNLLFLLYLGTATASLKIPFPSNKKEYTPLVFFTVPKDIIPACDEMEKTVKQVEKELGVRVERLDIVRDPTAEATLAALTQRRPPLLYNKESCQVVSVPGVSDDSTTNDSPSSSLIDKERVRAWAKGRFLPPKTAKSRVPLVLAKKDNSIDQKDLVEDMSLTPMQKSGKEAIKRRTEEKSEEASEESN